AGVVKALVGFFFGPLALAAAFVHSLAVALLFGDLVTVAGFLLAHRTAFALAVRAVHGVLGVGQLIEDFLQVIELFELLLHLLQIAGQLVELLGRLFGIAAFFEGLSRVPQLVGKLLHHLLLLLGVFIHFVEL